MVIWGVGFPDRPYNIRNIGLERLINFLKTDPVYGNCSVMLGVPTAWRSLNADCLPDPYLHELIKQADLVLPWAVQRFSPLLHEDMNRFRDILADDMKWCREHNVDYVPCVYPGFSWHNLSIHAFPDDIKPVGSIPRQGGRFYWQLISTAINTGARMLYVAMFDEVNEGTAIFKGSDTPPVSKATEFITMDQQTFRPLSVAYRRSCPDTAGRKTVDIHHARTKMIPANRTAPAIPPARKTRSIAIALLLPAVILVLAEVLLRVCGYGDNLNLFIEYPHDSRYLVFNPRASRRYFTDAELATTGNAELLRKEKRSEYAAAVCTGRIYYDRLPLFSQRLVSPVASIQAHEYISRAQIRDHQPFAYRREYLYDARLCRGACSL